MYICRSFGRLRELKLHAAFYGVRPSVRNCRNERHALIFRFPVADSMVSHIHQPDNIAAPTGSSIVKSIGRSVSKMAVSCTVTAIVVQLALQKCGIGGSYGGVSLSCCQPVQFLSSSVLLKCPATPWMQRLSTLWRPAVHLAWGSAGASVVISVNRQLESIMWRCAVLAVYAVRSQSYV